MEQSINWPRAIQTNARALAQVVEEIFGLLELALAGRFTHLPPEIHARALRLLRPAESALRRLIIIMARDVKATLPPPKPMPQGLAIRRSGQGRMAFKLHDTRKRMLPVEAQPKEDQSGPRIRFVFERGPLIPVHFTEKPKANRAVHLCRRFAALSHALETLPQQARRLARWRLRRARKANAKFTSPLRPGKPPGHQQRPRLKIDFVLQTCHGLAFDVLAANSS